MHDYFDGRKYYACLIYIIDLSDLNCHFPEILSNPNKLKFSLSNQFLNMFKNSYVIDMGYHHIHYNAWHN